MFKNTIIIVIALFYSGLVLSQEMPANHYGSIYATPALISPQQNDYMQLSARASTKKGEFTKMPAGIKSEPAFSEDWLTANKIHKYLGIGSITMALLAAIVPKPPKDNEDEGNHKAFAEAAAALGGAAVASGIMFHYDDIFDYGASDPDNLHATYATLGAIGFAMAVSDAPEAGHVRYGMLGAVLMTIGIKYTW